MINRIDVLIAVALTFTLGALTHYPPQSGVLAMFLGFGFSCTLLWLKSRDKDESPTIMELRSEIKSIRAEFEVSKNKLDGLLLRGRRD